MWARYAQWGATALSFTMILNAWNVLIVRMQNIDYEHHKSLRRAVFDLVRNDKHRALYKGMVP